MKKFITLLSCALFFAKAHSQYIPKNATPEIVKNAQEWADHTYNSLSQEEKLGQLFIVALYTNKGEDYIENVRQLVANEKLGGLILMQDDAEREINLLNEFQAKSKVPLLIGMDAEWGLFQRIKSAHKLPWAITLGAIQDKSVVREMAAQIAKDAKRIGVNWDFAPVVDVNTNPNNPIIGNRSFGSDVQNVVASATAYSAGLQDNNILAAIKHFPGHGDTNTDSHLDLPVISHSQKRLNEVELAPFRAMANSGIGGVMVAHLYVPQLEKQKGIPASISKNIITKLLKQEIGYKGLIITDALNMGAVAKRYKPGELDALAFKAGNDIMLFSEGVKEGKRLIQQAVDNGEIPQSRVEESVKKILTTKYFLGLNKYTPIDPKNINNDLNSAVHTLLARKVYANALTLIKDDKKLLPLKIHHNYYYLPLEEASYTGFYEAINTGATVMLTTAATAAEIPAGSTVIVGIHKDNSTAYKPFKISESSKQILADLSKKNQVILNIFGSPYALQDLDISTISTVLISYENNDDSMAATAAGMLGETPIKGRLPVVVGPKLPYGIGIDLMTPQK